jgi:hypothetical protein
VTALLSAGFVLSGIGVAAVLAAFLSPGSELRGVDLRVVVLVPSLALFRGVATYIVWPSRWNIPAHTQVVFSILAFFIPLVFLDSLEDVPRESADLYAKVMLVGALAFVAGTIGGGVAAHATGAARTASQFRFSSSFLRVNVPRRVALITGLGVVGLMLSFVVMGFVPALAADPAAAKFFRRQYQAPYERVAPVFRTSVTVLTTLLPLILAVWWEKRRERLWIVLAVLSAALLALTLQRTAIASGALLFIGVAFAWKGRGFWMFFGVLVAAYAGGAVFYDLLALFGVGTGSNTKEGASVLEQFAAGSPDVSDATSFLGRWIANPEYTYGRTFYGGLVPFGYEWNPAVWSLKILNPGIDASQIASGGLRLPAPVWGLVSFGWPGVVLVSAASGVVSGFVARLAHVLLPRETLLETVAFLVLYTAFVAVFVGFFLFNYATATRLLLVAAVLWPLVRTGRGWTSATPPS